MEAKEAGYTEPDPRDDLSGKDVARKVMDSFSLNFIVVHECAANFGDLFKENRSPGFHAMTFL